MKWLWKSGCLAALVSSVFLSGASQGALYISEFMASNKRTVQDEDGAYPDWVEIYNAGTAKVDLTGWALTNESTNLFRWRFPKVALLPGEYQLVFASGKNRTNAFAPLHTNFKLSRGGGYLALVDASSNVVSKFGPGYPPQQPDVSFGRDRVNLDLTGFLSRPTPGKANDIEGPGAASPVVFSRSSGTFVEPFLLKLSVDSPGAVIHYSLNSAPPTAESPVYSSPMAITNSTVVRARAFMDGLLPGPPRTEAFVALSTNVISFNSDLPLLVLHTMGTGKITSSRHQFAYMGWFEPRTGRSSLTNRPVLSTLAGVRDRGSSTLGLPKSSWAAEFWDEFQAPRHASPLDLPAESDWVLYAPDSFDPPLIHNPFVHTLSRNTGLYSSRTRFVEVFLVNGSGAVTSNSYNGIYVLEEKIKQGKSRVDVDKLRETDNTPPEVTGGYVLKTDRPGPGETGIAAGGARVLFVDPKESEIKLPQRAPQLQYISNYLAAFAKTLTSGQWRDPQSGYPAFIDVENWIDYHTIEVLSGNVDALVLSTYYYKPRNGKISFGPHWDFDRSLGSTDGRDSNPKVWNTGPFFTSPWWSRLFTDRDFWQKWVDHWQELRRTNLSNTNINDLVDSLANEVRDAQPRDRARWKVTLRGGTFQSEINLMKSWLSNRMEFIDKQLVQPPVLSSEGGLVNFGFAVSIAGPSNATVYYTLDGSDPRAPQGDLSSKALLYSGGPIRIQDNARVVARARNLLQRQTSGPPTSTPWSGPVAASFITRPLPLIISEIMYHPQTLSSGKSADGDNFEFIEIKNTGQEAVDLTGVRFTRGVHFDFTGSSVTQLAPGAIAVVAKQRAAFVERYGVIPNLAGEYTGSLDNNGERLTLTGPFEETILDVIYDNNWYPIANGRGFSLVPAMPSSVWHGWSDRRSWRPSTSVNGSPGKDDSAPAEFPEVVVNEVLPQTTSAPAVELFNPSSNAADISGWYLTDDPDLPKKFKIPSGTVLAPWRFKVFDGSTLSNGASGLSPNPGAGRIWLFSANAAGDLTGYLHQFPFRAARTGEAYGRFLTATGQEIFWPETAPTLGTPNRRPAIGRLLINEIMFRPPPFRTNLEDVVDQFVEIYNNSAQVTVLGNSSTGTNTWKLAGGIAYEFPLNLILAPHELVLVVNFDPDLDPGERNFFRSKYHLNAEVRLLGPFAGKLNQHGDTLTVLEPRLSVGTAGQSSVDFVLADEVTYSNQAPWPATADGTGLSIQRRTASSIADDPSNWVSGSPTPGSLNVQGDIDGDGLSDQWELAHNLDPYEPSGRNGPGGDPDGDGFFNMEEFQDGTDPMDPSSDLSISHVDLATGAVRLKVYQLPGQSSTIVYTDQLQSGQWLRLKDLESTVQGQLVEVVDPGQTPRPMRFYRLITPKLQ